MILDSGDHLYKGKVLGTLCIHGYPWALRYLALLTCFQKLFELCVLCVFEKNRSFNFVFNPIDVGVYKSVKMIVLF